MWSNAVAMARRKIFFAEKIEDSGYKVQLRDQSEGLNPTVELFVEDEDWTCTCGGADPCVHVAASAISIKRHLDAGEGLPGTEKEVAQIVYEWYEIDDDLHLRRKLSYEGREEVLHVSLFTLASGKMAELNVIPTQLDLKVEKCIDDLDNYPNLKSRQTLLREMSQIEVEKVFYQGKPIKSDASPMGLIAEVSDDGQELTLHLRQSPEVVCFYKNGWARTEEDIHPLLIPDLGNEFRSYINKPQVFRGESRVDVLTRVLPELENLRITVLRQNESRTTSSSLVAMPLSVVLVTERQDDESVTVVPRLAYGKPPVAIIKNAMAHLIDSQEQSYPKRFLDKERQTVDEAWQKSQLRVDEKITLNGLKDMDQAVKLRSLGLREVGEALSQFKVMGTLDPELAFKEEGELEVQFTFAGRRIKAEDVLSAYAKGEKFVKESSGSWLQIPVAWCDEYANSVLDILEGQKDNSHVSVVDSLKKVDLANKLGLESPEPIKVDQERVSRALAIKQVKPRVKAKLRSYQETGILFLERLKEAGLGALLADDMGLGKTLQALSVLEPQSLVVVPTSLISNWQEEARKFRPDLEVSLYHGPKRELMLQTVVITTYGILRSDIDVLSKSTWNVVVLDESQNIKNPQSQTAIAACKVPSKFKLALSGTPIENRLEELWSQFHFILPGYLSSLTRFKKLTRNMKFLENLKQQVSPFLLRRLKEDVAKDLPPREEFVQFVDFSEEEKKTYSSYLNAGRKEVVEKLDSGASVMDVLPLITKLRQISCEPRLCGIETDQLSSKTQVIVDRARDIHQSDHKVLIFSQWTQYLDIIGAQLQTDEVPYFRIDGSTKASDRQQMVQKFQSDEGTRVFLLSLKAGGVGLNITAADYVLIADPWWNPAVEKQAQDRAHRIGQTRTVFVNKLITKNSIEEGILKLQKRKAKLSDELIEVQELSEAGTLTAEDILGLFE